MGCRPATVRRYLHLAREKLATQLSIPHGPPACVIETFTTSPAILMILSDSSPVCQYATDRPASSSNIETVMPYTSCVISTAIQSRHGV